MLALLTNLAASKDLFCRPVEEPFAQELSPSMYWPEYTLVMSVLNPPITLHTYVQINYPLVRIHSLYSTEFRKITGWNFDTAFYKQLTKYGHIFVCQHFFKTVNTYPKKFIDIRTSKTEKLVVVQYRKLILMLLERYKEGKIKRYSKSSPSAE